MQKTQQPHIFKAKKTMYADNVHKINQQKQKNN